MEGLTTAKKLSTFIDYLQKGGEITIDGHTYVWLDNHFLYEIQGVPYGIDGLAIKGVSINSMTKEEKPHYMGQSDIPLNHLLKLIDKISMDEWFSMSASLVLKDMNKKRA